LGGAWPRGPPLDPPLQVPSYGRQCVPERGVSLSREPKVVKFCTQVGYINSSNRKTYH